jgi:RNA polymerase-binding transcription factor DksA
VAAITAGPRAEHSFEDALERGIANPPEGNDMTLTEEQRRHLEARLREERERALDVIRRYDEGRSNPDDDGDLTNYPFHLADQGTDSFDQELSTQLADRASRTLEEIDAALQRLYETPERFGVSESTGAPIPFERLDIIPWARTEVTE